MIPKKSTLIFNMLLGLWLCMPFSMQLQAQSLASLNKFDKDDKVFSARSTQDNQQLLKSFLSDMEKEYLVRFAYSGELVENKTVNTKATKKYDGLEETLTEVLQPLKLTYKKMGSNYYVIQKVENAGVDKVDRVKLRGGPDSSVPYLEHLKTQAYNSFSRPMDKTITGKVTDGETDDALPGVNVVAKNTNTGTVTDINGNYRLTVEDNVEALVFSSVGYESQEVNIGGRSVINVDMAADVQALSEIVVIGYGTQRKSDLTGAVSSVSREDLELPIINTPDQALQGKAAGVNVFTGSHEPGGAMSVEVRGTASINAGGSPLYVIDGVPLSDYVGTSNLGGNGPSYNPMANIDPSSIQSMEVLKGASATAIYGSRGSNGVVLITTKEGEAGKAKIDYSGSVSFSGPVNKLDFLNATEHAMIVNERAALLDNPPVFTQEQIDAFGEGTDWQEEIFRQPAVSQKHQLSISGGNDAIRYYLAGSYVDEDGLIIGSNFKRYGATLNMNAQVSERFKIDQHLMLSSTTQDRVFTGRKGYGTQGDIMSYMIDTSPTIPVYDENGDYTDTRNVALGGDENPVYAAREYDVDRWDTRIVGNIAGTYTLLDGLDAVVRIGVDVLDYQIGEYFPIGSRPAQFGEADFDEYRRNNLLNENLLKYNNTFGIHRLDVLAGFTYQTENSFHTSASGKGFPSDAYKYWNLGIAASPDNPTTSRDDWTLLSWIGRINYVLADKYLITLTGRADGSSKFGANNKWGFFPSAAVAWRVSNEDFMSNAGPVSNLKLRLSYGQSGNDRIGVYESLSLINFASSDGSSWLFGTNDPNGKVVRARPNGIANPDLGWEKSEDIDVGFDLGMYNDRINLTFDYYYQKTTDLLLDVPLPNQAGYRSVLQNTGSMENRGIEITLNTYNLTGEFKWNTTLVMSRNKNEILSLGGAPFIYTGWAGGGNVSNHGRQVARLEPGHAIGKFYGSVMHENRVWASQAEIDEVGTMPNANPGDYRFKDLNGDGRYSADDDTFVGDPNPDVIFGFTNDFSYKNFNLRVFFQGMWGNTTLMVTKNEIAGGTNLWKEDREKRWTPENPRVGGDVTNSVRGAYPALVTDDNAYDGSFVRLKNIQLSYNIPVQNTIFRNAQIYVAGRNLLTFTKYPGWDPEVNASGGSNRIKGVDRFPYPSSKSFIVGVNIGF